MNSMYHPGSATLGLVGTVTSRRPFTTAGDLDIHQSLARVERVRGDSGSDQADPPDPVRSGRADGELLPVGNLRLRFLDHRSVAPEEARGVVDVESELFIGVGGLPVSALVERLPYGLVAALWVPAAGDHPAVR